ncbi:PA14 domain [Micractinium conductrix]|uniref:PA14 domain n=1 Tax=Micractinium conductrix TaxID=554055 RepID=A0A2P6VK57_9CHLO|nr:PA14 domain [Micractinium conductrix]|eukprot:PSC74479.1 PA14 domain [Micractinium conductrix]
MALLQWAAGTICKTLGARGPVCLTLCGGYHGRFSQQICQLHQCCVADKFGRHNPSPPPPRPFIPRGIRMRAYSPYVVTVVPDINLPANYSESYLGAPVADKVLPYVNCERDPAVASQCQGADLPCDGTCFNSPNFFATQNFAAQFTGQVLAPVAGDYTFILISDDGSRLFIDSQLVIENDGPKGTLFEAPGTVTLTAGWHPITLLYAQGPDHYSVQLLWSSAAIPKQTVPENNLTPLCCDPLPFP